MKSKSNDELAAILESQQVDRTALNEAAYRLRRIELDQLLVATGTVEAIHASPVIDRKTASKLEGLILSSAINTYKPPSSRLVSLADRILKGEPYSHEDVVALAALVVVRNEAHDARTVASEDG